MVGAGLSFHATVDARVRAAPLALMAIGHEVLGQSRHVPPGLETLIRWRFLSESVDAACSLSRGADSPAAGASIDRLLSYRLWLGMSRLGELDLTVLRSQQNHAATA